MSCEETGFLNPAVWLAPESKDECFGGRRGRLRTLNFLAWICMRITNHPSISMLE